MKKLIMFLAGLMLLVLMFGALYFTGAIYDAGSRTEIDTFFFQPNNLSSMRVGVPASPEELGESKVRDRLIGKFITEYFYATPDAENIARRTRPGSPMSQMTTATVFNAWQNGEAQVIQELAGKKAMRMATVIGEIRNPVGSKYYEVDYELKTWATPNDLSSHPSVSRGTMFLDITYEPGIRESIREAGIHKYLDDGGDPAALFKFRVNEIARH